MILKSYSNLFKSYRIHLEVEAINMSSLTFISFVNISDRFVHKVLKLFNNTNLVLTFILVQNQVSLYF